MWPGNVTAAKAANWVQPAPMGSEKAGNADGTIPAWDGGITRAPAGYRAGRDHIDPFAADKVEFQITPANYQKYADKLGAGQKAMFAKYKTFRMDIYPTRRSASFPERTYEFSKKNATQCKLIANGEGIQNCAEGFPFPIPNDAYEAIWNHKLKYKGLSVRRYSNQVRRPPWRFHAGQVAGRNPGLVLQAGQHLRVHQQHVLYYKQDLLAPPAWPVACCWCMNPQRESRSTPAWCTTGPASRPPRAKRCL